MHVLFLPKTLYGADVEAVLGEVARRSGGAICRRRPAAAIRFVTARRSLVPADRPGGRQRPVVHEHAELGADHAGGGATTDLSATDAVSAWGITTGSAGIVIADVDTGVRFDHPDLLRARFRRPLAAGLRFRGPGLRCDQRRRARNVS